MAETSLIYINGTALPMDGLNTYTNLSVDVDSENTARDELAIMHRDRIRAGARKFTVSYTVHPSVAKVILNAISPASFTVRAFDIMQNAWVTFTGYAGDRTSTMKVCTDINNMTDALWEVGFSLIEN